MIALVLGACTSQRQATTYVNDDVYNDGPRKTTAVNAPSQSGGGAQVITAPDQAQVQSPPSATQEDLNDYSYANRIKRFNSTDTTKGYFDDSYNGGSTAENNAGSGPDVNFYMGYGGYFGPSFSYSWGYPSSYLWDSYWGWGYPYYYRPYSWYSSWYNPWYSPWYDPWYSPWNDPWYCHTCCSSYGEPWAYNHGSTYYGTRRSLFRTDGGGSSTGRTSVNPSENPLRRSQPGSLSRSGDTRNVRSVPAGQENYRYTRPAGTRQVNFSRTKPGSMRQDLTQSGNRQPAPRYTRPENLNNQRTSPGSQSYSSPVYRQPKSSQEYLAPRSQNPGATRSSVGTGETRTNPGFSTPRSGNTRSYSTPSRSGNNSYSTPRSGGNNSYTPPSRSTQHDYTPPTRSNENRSYSTPSNSGNNNSYSAPSRTEPSGGSSGNSGRRR